MANERPGKDDRDDIQGNLVGFNKDRQRLLFVQFPDATHGRQFLGALHPEITSATDVLHANAEYKRFVKEEGHDPAEFDTAGVNVALTSGGLAAVGAPDVDTFPPEFTSGMRQRAGLLGDVDASAPANWVPPFNHDSQVHAMVIIAADNAAKRDEVRRPASSRRRRVGWSPASSPPQSPLVQAAGQCLRARSGSSTRPSGACGRLDNLRSRVLSDII